MRHKLFGSCLSFCLLQVTILAATGYGDTLQYFAQAVAGGGAVTVFSIHNPGGTSGQVRIELIDSDGHVFYTSDQVVPALGVKTVNVAGSPSDLKVGWARLTALSGQFEATEFFQLSIGGQALPRVGVLPCEPANSLKLFAYLVNQTNTGLAIANPSSAQNAVITMRRYNALGSLVGTASTTLGPLEHVARFLSEDPWFPGLASFEGIVELQSTRPIVVTMLRSDNSLLSSAAVLSPDLSSLAPGSVTTEYLADGAVTNDKLAQNSVTGDRIVDGSVVSADLAANAVTENKIADGVVTSSKIKDGTVQPQDLASPFWLTVDKTAPFLPFSIQSKSSGQALAVSVGTYGGVGPAVVSAWAEGIPAMGIYAKGYGSYWGVMGVSDNAPGVHGYSQTTHGVHGKSESGWGVYGESNENDGLTGVAKTNLKSGIFAVNDNSAGYAGYFRGKVHVQGDMSTSGTKPFKIDHPLDPENRYLLHAAVESDEVLNFYSGNVALDWSGAAEVELPEWFEALNTDFRYALTAIGSPGQGLYVAEEVKGNRFKIAGGTAGAKVSWQITARRNDPGMRLRPFSAEQVKHTYEQGTYLDPAAYGQPPEKGYDRFRERPAGSGAEAASSNEFVPPPTYRYSLEAQGQPAGSPIR